MKRFVVVLALASLAVGTVTAMPRAAEAQTRRPVTAFPQGMIGMGLLGGELVVMIQGAAGLRARWAYIVFPLLGIAGGAIGGYFVDQALDGPEPMAPAMRTMTNGPAEISTGLMIAGLGLVIPSIIMYATATSYRPDDSNRSDDNAPANEPLEESATDRPGAAGGTPGSGSGSGTSGTGTGAGTGSGTTPAPAGGTSGGTGGGTGGGTRPPTSYVPSGLFNRTAAGAWQFGMPNVGMVASYGLEERMHFNAPATTEWRFNLISGRF